MAKAKARRSAKTSVVEILESKNPVLALRRFLATAKTPATVREGQVALGAAQLALAGDNIDAAALTDLVLKNWERFPDQSGFHAEAFLRNAFEAEEDPARLERLLMYATASGIDLVIEQAPIPDIPVWVEPHVLPVRMALQAVISDLGKLGQPTTMNRPATLDDILTVERERRIQLPNDFRALLTITNGLEIWSNTFFATSDYGSETQLAKDALQYLGAAGIEACVPIANWGQPTDWLIYDPLGLVRRGDPGYVLMSNSDERPLEDLIAAIEHLGEIATDVLRTN